jgi:hypothetical protein
MTVSWALELKSTFTSSFVRTYFENNIMKRRAIKSSMAILKIRKNVTALPCKSERNEKSITAEISMVTTC